MKNIKLIISSIILSFLFVSNGFACSCMMPLEPKEEAKNSKAVFIGKVVKIDQKKSKDDPYFNNSPQKVYFEISTNIKGENKKNKIVKTEGNSAMCGYYFEKGKEYIVYTYGEEGNLSTGICTRTSLLENAKEDKKAFEKEIKNNTPGDNKNIEIKSDFDIEKVIYLSIFIISIILIIGLKKNTKKDS